MFEVKLNAPLNVEWEVTNLCNLRCRHCYVSAGESLAAELTTEEALTLIDELDQIGVSDITISGGEPFLRNDIWEIIKELKKREIPFILYTNGTLLNNMKVRRLVETGVKTMSVSLNGARPETHNFVQNAPTFEKVLEVMKMIKSKNIRLQVLFTLMKINAHEIDDLFILAEEIGIDVICVYPFYPVGRGKNALDHLEMNPKNIKNILMMALEKAKDYSMKVYVGGCLNRYYSSTEKHSLIKGAPCAKLMAIITADGHLRPCNFLPFRTKHGVKARKITELWKGPIFQKIRDWNKFTELDCSGCDSFPVCFGSCLSIHIQRFNNVNLESELEKLSESI